MVAALSDWLRHLVTLLLLAVILDAVLPGRTMHRYVRTVLGLLIMLSILLPLRSLAESNFNVTSIVSSLSGPVLPTMKSTDKLGSATYSTDLQAALKEELTTNSGVTVKSVQVITNMQADGTEIMTAVSVVIAPQVQGNKTDVAASVRSEIEILTGLPETAVNVSTI
jgi:stage III sporulation protein AF